MDPKKFNLNSVLTLAMGSLVSAMVAFVWNTVVDMKASNIRLEANQTIMQKGMAEVVPRAELELRFRTLEGQLLEVKVHIQAIDLEVIKLRDRK